MIIFYFIFNKMTEEYFTKMKNIDNEITKTNRNIDEKSILYNVLLKELNYNDEIIMNIDKKIEYIETEINGYNYALNYNYIDNYMNMLSILKEANNNLNILRKSRIDQNNIVKMYENQTYNSHLQIQILTCYLEDLNKMMIRIERWGGVEKLTDFEKETEACRNNMLFEMQLNSIKFN